MGEEAGPFVNIHPDAMIEKVDPARLTAQS
jgi:hypothetical protein